MSGGDGGTRQSLHVQNDACGDAEEQEEQGGAGAARAGAGAGVGA